MSAATTAVINRILRKPMASQPPSVSCLGQRNNSSTMETHHFCLNQIADVSDKRIVTKSLHEQKAVELGRHYRSQECLPVARRAREQGEAKRARAAARASPL